MDNQFKNQNGKPGFAMVSLIIGIISIIISMTVGSIMGAVGLVLGIIALVKKEANRSMAFAGIVTSVIGIVAGIIWTVGFIAANGAA